MSTPVLLFGLPAAAFLAGWGSALAIPLVPAVLYPVWVLLSDLYRLTRTWLGDKPSFKTRPWYLFWLRLAIASSVLQYLSILSAHHA